MTGPHWTKAVAATAAIVIAAIVVVWIYGRVPAQHGLTASVPSDTPSTSIQLEDARESATSQPEGERRDVESSTHADPSIDDLGQVSNGFEFHGRVIDAETSLSILAASVAISEVDDGRPMDVSANGEFILRVPTGAARLGLVRAPGYGDALFVARPEHGTRESTLAIFMARAASVEAELHTLDGLPCDNARLVDCNR